MNWKFKAAIQNTVSRLPSSMSYASYYWMQRHFGGLKTTTPMDRLAAGIDTWKRIVEQRVDPRGKVFFEVGTGRAPMVPLAYWLMGAARTITMDINPYLNTTVARESLAYIDAHHREVIDLFGDLMHQQRTEELLRICKTRPFSLKLFLDTCGIEYIAPGDAADTGIPTGSIDFHTSYTVLEHIAPDVITGILEEGNRILRHNGLFVHMIDYTDHFSHSDKKICSINCLQYSDEEWARYAGNRFMYINRLRHDDVVAMFVAAGHQIVAVTPYRNDRSLELLRDGRLRLDPKFAVKTAEVLSIHGSWIVSQRIPTLASTKPIHSQFTDDISNEPVNQAVMCGQTDI